MKKRVLIAGIACLLLSACTNQGNGQKGTEEQNYILVDAKVKIYHEDGTRSYKDYAPFKTRTIELLPGYETPKKQRELSIYGGDISKKSAATGFFYVKKEGDRWWGIDPEGNHYVNVALNSINMGKSEGTKQAMKDKFGTPDNWIKETLDTLNSHGFNCAGSWSDVEAIIKANETADKPMPYTINWNFMSSYGHKRGGTFQQPGHTGYPNDAIFVFDPEFEEYCDERAKKLETYKDDPNLFGHFSDNEMPFKFKALDNFLDLPTDEYGHKAAVEWLTNMEITIEQITDSHRELFMAYVGEKYFSIVSKAIKKYDPNHMFIGSRFYSKEKNHELFMRAIGKHLDIVTINYYNCWTPNAEQTTNWTKWTGKPYIVTEYYAKGDDAGLANTSGAGWIVRTQTDRGNFYQNYNLALLESKNCVGWHYFKYQDNDPTAKGVDPSNLDANKGIVSNRYEYWTPMMVKMKELNTQVYNLIEYFDSRN